MAEEVQKTLPLSAEISAQIQKAESSDEISALLQTARDAAPADPSVKPKEEKTEPELFTETFSIGGKQVEISGADAADVLRQFKAAVQGHELGRAEKPAPVVEAKPVKTPAEINAEKFELESNFRLGKISATEFLEKSGAVDEYFQKRGIDPSAIKEVLEERKGAKVVKSWETATTEFIESFSRAGAAWPGGSRVRDLMGKTLIELGLADSPSPDSMQKAYDHLTTQGWDLMKIGQEDADAVKPKEAVAPPQPVAPAKAPRKASGLFNVSGNAGGGKDLGRPPEAPKVEADDTPESILEKWKAANLAAGRNPDDALRETYGVSRVQ